MSQTKNFTLGLYFQILIKLLGKPRKFFNTLPQSSGLKQPLCFLFVSSAFFAGASLIIIRPPNPFLMGGILFINAVGMVLIAAGIGYMVMTMIMGRQVAFTRFFSIYALSSGVTLLVSWLPFFMWLTEPWKWLLIGSGMVKACGFRRSQALAIILLSLAILILFFWALLPVILSLK